MVEVFKNGFVGGGTNCTIWEKVGRHRFEAEGLKSGFLEAGARRSDDTWMGRVVRAKGTSKELGTKKVKVIFYREIFGFRMKVAKG